MRESHFSSGDDIASCLRSSRLHDPFLQAGTGSLKSFSSNDNTGVHRPVRLALIQSKAIQQPLQLAPAHGQCAVLLGRGPLEAPLLKAAIIETKPVVIPLQDLSFVPTAVTENKEGRRKRIELERLADQRRQAVNRLAHVRTAASQVDALHLSGADQHEL